MFRNRNEHSKATSSAIVRPLMHSIGSPRHADGPYSKTTEHPEFRTMYVVTNRQLTKEIGDLGIFSKEPNQKGPNELRLVKVTKSGSKYKATAIKEVPIPQSKKRY